MAARPRARPAKLRAIKLTPRIEPATFQAKLPDQVWHSNLTHWHLADGRGVEILDWLDDHSRYVLVAPSTDRSPDP